MLAEVQSGDDEISRMLRDLAALPGTASASAAAGSAASVAHTATAFGQAAHDRISHASHGGSFASGGSSSGAARLPVLSQIKTALSKSELDELQRIINAAMTAADNRGEAQVRFRDSCDVGITCFKVHL